jgi:hypothetical protein
MTNVEEVVLATVKDIIKILNDQIAYNKAILIADSSYGIHSQAAITGAIGRIKREYGLDK